MTLTQINEILSEAASRTEHGLKPDQKALRAAARGLRKLKASKPWPANHQNT